MEKLIITLNIIIGFISLTLITPVIAQQPFSEEIEPLGYAKPSLIETSISKSILAKNLDSIKQFDERLRQTSRSGIPYRIGYPNRVDVNIMTPHLRQKVDEDSLAILSLHIEDAKAVYLLFDKFWLPPGSSLFIYNKQKTHFVGPYNYTNNNGTRSQVKGFCSGLVAGDEIIVEYHPPENNDSQAIISLESVINVYNPPRFLFNKIKEFFQAKNNTYSGFGDFGLSGDCQVLVNCSPEGDDWQDEKKSVVLILLSDGRHCTGFLINNTKSDDTPYLITANHCYVADPSPLLWDFYFMYESDSSVCPCPEWGDDEPSAVELTNGGTLLARDDSIDFVLLELNKDPKEIFLKDTLAYYDSIYYAGWDRTNDQDSGGVGIHHPMGDVKMISTVNDETQYGPYPNSYEYYSGIYDWGVYWKQTDNNWSVVEGGSSGSPLFNADSKTIGQLRGDCADSGPSCDNPGANYNCYGKFYNSWNNGSQASERLKDWLDPLGINPTALDGRYAGSLPVDPCKYSSDTITIANTTITSDATFSAKCRYTFENTTIDNDAEVTVSHQWKTIMKKDFTVKTGSSFKVSGQ